VTPRWLPGIAAVAAALTVVCALWVDAPLARYLADHGVAARATWNAAVAALDAIGFAGPRWLVTGLVAGAALVAMAARSRGAAALRLLAVSHVVARISMIWIKDATGRLRPLEWLDAGGDMFGRVGGVGFPSGHVTYYLSLTLPLVVAAPRRAWILIVPAALCAARVAVDDHFASDVTGAIAWVALVTYAAGRALAVTSPGPGGTRPRPRRPSSGTPR
jgi:membrane-associated phospholipid phosphatase